ncbi:KPN_02809 family neutral zinc metallopeptidase [Thiothrix winogradskyi]|uniref:Zinc metallopeptidase n=1 Tax=Thiothrix winogradskyi TaxID=96472 RepID=A0ABY3SXC8_9GAMM|nr:neutral zinc metallopeptidase [Thiothrix winogradskyi]UJS23809.1 zinc metallopeptidase [Thiothrix winogradskyi]
MRWRTGRQSSNVEDRRGGRSSGGRGGMKIGLLGTVAAVLIGWYMGFNPIQILGLVGGANTILGGFGGGSSSETVTTGVPQDDAGKFVSSVLASTEDVWNPVFRQLGGRYVEPKLVLFTDSTDSVCGYSTAATGPFYCPADQKVYIDLGFFRELQNMGASGDFAQAYVLGHEIGHHVQNLMGTTTEVTRLQNSMSKRDGNALSVALELQADCYAGVWAHHAHKQFNILEEGDIEEAINAAGSIGDDRLQRMSGRRINPDSFTHGSSTQRMEWFQRGLKTGDLKYCDSFKS